MLQGILNIKVTMFSNPLTTVLALLSSTASATIYYAGVAESSGEFGVYSTSTHLLQMEIRIISNSRA